MQAIHNGRTRLSQSLKFVILGPANILAILLLSCPTPTLAAFNQRQDDRVIVLSMRPDLYPTEPLSQHLFIYLVQDLLFHLHSSIMHTIYKIALIVQMVKS